MSKVMKADFSSRRLADRLARAGGVTDDRQSPEGKAGLPDNRHVPGVGGLGIRQHDQVASNVLWFQSKQFPFA